MKKSFLRVFKQVINLFGVVLIIASFAGCNFTDEKEPDEPENQFSCVVSGSVISGYDNLDFNNISAVPSGDYNETVFNARTAVPSSSISDIWLKATKGTGESAKTIDATCDETNFSLLLTEPGTWTLTFGNGTEPNSSTYKGSYQLEVKETDREISNLALTAYYTGTFTASGTGGISLQINFQKGVVGSISFELKQGASQERQGSQNITSTETDSYTISYDSGVDVGIYTLNLEFYDGQSMTGNLLGKCSEFILVLPDKTTDTWIISSGDGVNHDKKDNYLRTKEDGSVIFYFTPNNIPEEDPDNSVPDNSVPENKYDIYVKSNYSGSDSDGTSEKPYKTIADAITKIQQINDSNTEYIIKLQNNVEFTTTVNSLDGKRKIQINNESGKKLAIKLTSDQTGAYTIQNTNNVSAISTILYVTNCIISLENITLQHVVNDTGSRRGIEAYNSTLYIHTGTTITNNKYSGGSGAGVYLSNSIAYMDGGTITGNESRNGGGVFITANSTFYLEGGEITSNTCTGGEGGAGVCIYENSKFIMNGGKISSNTASEETLGGGVFVHGEDNSTSIFTMAGGEISGNNAQNGGGIYLASGNTFEMTGGEILLNGNAYTSDGDIVTENGGGIYADSSTLRLYGGKIGDVDISTWESSGNKAQKGGGLYLLLSEVYINGCDIKSNLAGTYYGGGIYSEGSIIYFYNGNISNNTSQDNGGGLYITDKNSTKSKLYIRGGTIISNTSNDSNEGGGGIFSNNSLVYISGGKISGNIASNGGLGGGIYTSGNSIVNLFGGEISSNRAKNSGCGIYASGSDSSNKSIININGGKISGNTKQSISDDVMGAGIYAGSYSEINMNGGEISGNTASKFGGGIFVKENAKVSMTNGVISENGAEKGGGIYSNDGSKVTISGGEIIGNTATDVGGGIYSYYSEIEISGGTIGKTDNPNSALKGGGIYTEGSNSENKSSLTILDGNVSNNSATEDGGGIYAGSNSTVTMSGGEISLNTANTKGGGVYMNSGSSVIISGTLKDNVCTELGYSSGIYNISGALSIGNANLFDDSLSENCTVIFTGFHFLSGASCYFTCTDDNFLNELKEGTKSLIKQDAGYNNFATIDIKVLTPNLSESGIRIAELLYEINEYKNAIIFSHYDSDFETFKNDKTINLQGVIE